MSFADHDNEYDYSERPYDAFKASLPAERQIFLEYLVKAYANDRLGGQDLVAIARDCSFEELLEIEQQKKRERGLQFAGVAIRTEFPELRQFDAPQPAKICLN